MWAFFFSLARFLEATFLATFFFAREPGFFAPIAVATLFQTTPGAAVAVAAAVAAAEAAAWANSPARILVPSAALLPAATTVSCALVLMLLRVIIFHSPAERTTRKHRSLRKRSKARSGALDRRLEFPLRPYVATWRIITLKSSCVRKCTAWRTEA